jgi:uncharacterized membrane protein
MESEAKRRAQKRADRIRAFRAELAELEGEGALRLGSEQRHALEDHLERVLADFGARFDIDVSSSQRRISWGMRVTALLGGLALCAAFVLFLHRVWASLPVSAQVALLAGTPLLLLGVTAAVERSETSRYYTFLLAVASIGSFVAGTSVLGVVFNVTPRPHALLAWGVFCLLLAHALDLKLPLAAGLCCLLVWSDAEVALVRGASWQSFGMRPENLLAASLLVALAPSAGAARGRPQLALVYRLTGLGACFLALLVLSLEGASSYLPFSERRIEIAYQLAGLAGGLLVAALGIRKEQPPAVVNLGAICVVVFLYVRLFRWWWDWLPKYLIFLLAGLLALALLAAFRKLRRRTMAIAAP